MASGDISPRQAKTLALSSFVRKYGRYLLYSKRRINVAKFLVKSFKRAPLLDLVAVHPLPSLYLKVSLLTVEIQ